MKTRSKIASILYTLLFGVICTLYGQSVSQNYVRSAVMTAPFKNNPVTDFDLARVTVDYYDGLGRPVQQVRQAASGNAFDLHTITEYDSYGRPYRTWLPVESNGTSGAYPDSETLKSLAVDFYGDSRPYTETRYARIPETQEESIYGPGRAWHDKGKRTVIRRGINSGDPSSSYCCPRFDVDSEGRPVMNGYYDEGTLRYEETVDEDNITALSFFDTEKRKVLETRIDNNTFLDTYYVHNIIGQLSYVIPPKAASELLPAGNGVCDTAVVRNFFITFVENICL